LDLKPRIIRGDANADGTVNVLDLAIVGKNYGSERVGERSLVSVEDSWEFEFNELADVMKTVE
jgi:hypothetical protein